MKNLFRVYSSGTRVDWIDHHCHRMNEGVSSASEESFIFGVFSAYEYNKVTTVRNWQSFVLVLWRMLHPSNLLVLNKKREVKKSKKISGPIWSSLPIDAGPSNIAICNDLFPSG